jgi:phosphatidate cytidylyltransferase
LLRLRLIFGSLLTFIVLAALLIDGYLSTLPPSGWTIGAFDAGRWLFNGTLCTVTVLIFSSLAAHELVRFFRAGGQRPFGLAAQFFVAGLVVGPYISFNLQAITNWADESWGLLWISAAAAFLFLAQAARYGTENAMGNLSATLFIIIYAGMAGFMPKLRMELRGWEGIAALLFSTFTVKMTDTGAFFVGSLLGRHKLIEWLSPKKTWEGFFGGLALTIAFSYGVGSYLYGNGLLNLGSGWLAYPWGLLIFGLLMGLISTAGDLCASLLKRDAALKDSGNVIPGMGGILDVLDSPLLAAPAAWFFWTRLVHL